MLEEKSVKHWLKRKVKFTEALLVAFLITGGIASAESANASSSNKMKYYGVSEESMPGTGEKEPKNEYGEGARGGKKSIAIGENARVGTWKRIWESHIGTVNEGYNFYYGKAKDYKLTEDDVDKVYFSDGDNSVVLGNDAKADYANSVVIGTQADSTRGNSNVVVGHKAKLSGYNGVVIGENSRGSSTNLGVIAIGKDSRAAGGIVIGTEAKLGRWEKDKNGEETNKEDLGGGIVIGRKASATTLTNVVIGDEARSAKDYSVVLGSYAKVENRNATAVGNAADVTVDGGIALGGSSSSTTKGGKMGYDPMTGKTRENLGEEADKLYDNWVKAYKEWEADQENINKKKATDEAAKAYHKVSSVWESSTGALSVGDSGYTRQITNVAAGTEDTDAVNVAQLKALKEHTEENTKKMTKKLHHLGEEIDGVRSESKKIGALGAAMAALNPMEYNPMKPNQILAGVGSYKNSQAVAVGMSHHFNENLRVQAGVSVSEGRKTESMVNLGLAWKIGKDDRDDSYNKYKEGPISSIYVMQDEMKQVMEENKNLKSEVEEMKKQLQTLIIQK